MATRHHVVLNNIITLKGIIVVGLGLVFGLYVPDKIVFPAGRIRTLVTLKFVSLT